MTHAEQLAEQVASPVEVESDPEKATSSSKKKTTKAKLAPEKTPLAWEAVAYEHPVHGKLDAEKAVRVGPDGKPVGTFQLYKEPGEKMSRMDYLPTNATIAKPARSAGGPVDALKRLAQAVADDEG